MRSALAITPTPPDQIDAQDHDADAKDSKRDQ